jgi:hypothetical protein
MLFISNWKFHRGCLTSKTGPIGLGEDKIPSDQQTYFAGKPGRERLV